MLLEQTNLLNSTGRNNEAEQAYFEADHSIQGCIADLLLLWLTRVHFHWSQTPWRQLETKKHNTMGTVGTELRLDYARHAMQNTFEKSFIGTQS